MSIRTDMALERRESLENLEKTDGIDFECDKKDIAVLTKWKIEFDKILDFQNVNELSFFVKQMYFEKYSNNSKNY